ncbi:hypothetical protein MRB53_026495 [Persea americana]|uniref:Uncharacterized protein n=1 Tax=Persea americana TaxID=3435 RepID=A0ACC2LID2_PERAE|nr:hypothetical protein MRB53_026495 [Persea americana]
MTQKSSDLLHLHLLPAGSPKSNGLEERGSGDERLTLNRSEMVSLQQKTPLHSQPLSQIFSFFDAQLKSVEVPTHRTAQSRRPSLSLPSSSGSGNEGILARVSNSISQSSIVHQGMSVAADTAFVAKKLLRSTACLAHQPSLPPSDHHCHQVPWILCGFQRANDQEHAFGHMIYLH